MIRIFVDSASDYTLEDLKKQNLELFPISIIIGDDTYQDAVNLQRDDLYRMLSDGCPHPTTSQPSPQLFLDAFESACQAGDELIYITLSSALSGTYQSACMARDMVEYDKIHIIDSLSATYNIKLLADHAAALRQQGVDAPTIVAQVEALKGRTRVIAVPDTLEFLYKGGRVSRTSAAIGTLANIKPIITVTPDGKIGVPGKCIGMGKAQAYLLKYLQEHPADPAFPLYSIYSYGTDNCEKMEAKLAAAEIPVAARLQIGPTIGTHIGPNALGIVYMEK